MAQPQVFVQFHTPVSSTNRTDEVTETAYNLEPNRRNNKINGSFFLV